MIWRANATSAKTTDGEAGEVLKRRFDLQGHRGARGRKPENTLPSFEIALDACVTSIETDLHLSGDGTIIVIHDAHVSPRICRRISTAQAPESPNPSLVSSLTCLELRNYVADQNPDPFRFAEQDATSTPLALAFAEQRHVAVYGIPTLAELFAFVSAYSGALGAQVGKSLVQRESAKGVRFELELKRVPFHPQYIGDDYDGAAAAVLEIQLVAAIRAAGFFERSTIRSFDHRCLYAVKQLEPSLRTAVLVAGTALANPGRIAREAGAEIYCPDFEFLDEPQVRAVHAGGVAVVPWTVNHLEDWRRLIDWGVDGITTDYPDRLAEYLRDRSIPF